MADHPKGKGLKKAIDNFQANLGQVEEQIRRENAKRRVEYGETSWTLQAPPDGCSHVLQWSNLAALEDGLPVTTVYVTALMNQVREALDLLSMLMIGGLHP